MASKKLVKKLVKMVEEDNLLDQNGENQMEEKPLELYELEEFAKRRVLLRKSYKIHFLVILPNFPLNFISQSILYILALNIFN